MKKEISLLNLIAQDVVIIALLVHGYYIGMYADMRTNGAVAILYGVSMIWVIGLTSMIAYRVYKKPDVYLWKDVSPKYLTMTRIEIVWIIAVCFVVWGNLLSEYFEAILFIYVIGAVVLYFVAKKKRKQV